MSYTLEPTPADELIDDAAESLLRAAVFDVGDIPAPDFSLDVDPIETGMARKRQQERRSLALSLFRLLALYDLPPVSALAPGPQVWYTLMAVVAGCTIVFCCCLFFPDFPVLSDHTLSHPGLLIF